MTERVRGGGGEMEGAPAAVQQKRKSNHFLITLLPRLVGLIWRKRIMLFDRSRRVPVKFHRRTLQSIGMF